MNQLANQVFGWVFRQVIKQEFLAGKRSYIAGASSILGGLVMVTEMAASGEYSETKMGMAWAAFVLGYKIIGDAGKKDAQLEATKNAVQNTSQASK